MCQLNSIRLLVTSIINFNGGSFRLRLMTATHMIQLHLLVGKSMPSPMVKVLQVSVLVKHALAPQRRDARQLFKGKRVERL